jgi:hypothetical protein
MPKNTFPNVPTPSSSSSRYSFTEHNTHEIRSRRALGARRFLSDGRRTVALILFGLCVSQQCHQSRNLRHKIRRRRLCPLEQSRRQQAERRNSPLLQQGPRTKRTENVTNALSTDSTTSDGAGMVGECNGLRSAVARDPVASGSGGIAPVACTCDVPTGSRAEGRGTQHTNGRHLRA